MRILLTSGASSPARELAARLSILHDVRLVDYVDPPPKTAAEFDFAVSPLGHDASTRLLVQDRDAVIVWHPTAGPENEELPATELIDRSTWGVYNLLMAACEAGVQKVICLSTLELMAAYAPEFTVNERWRPRPTTEPGSLAAYLTEAVCREFGREHKLMVTVLRLGDLAGDDSGAKYPASLRMGDLADAVARALEAEPTPWSVYHIQSTPAEGEGRFSTELASKRLGFGAERTVDAVETTG